MSTEHQRYSISNQSAAIALYAAAHNMGIIRSFVDGGKTGTTIKCRKGLQELLRLVASGAADFKQVLVYDVSRWGRFPDSDEAAHYEFLCKQAGIAVHYCAEQFDNDNSTTSNLLKALKQVMSSNPESCNTSVHLRQDLIHPMCLITTPSGLWGSLRNRSASSKLSSGVSRVRLSSKSCGSRCTRRLPPLRSTATAQPMSRSLFRTAYYHFIPLIFQQLNIAE